MIRRRARRVIWLNPLMGDPRYRPEARGIEGRTAAHRRPGARSQPGGPGGPAAHVGTLVKVREKFSVNAPADEVWAFLIDPERVAARATRRADHREGGREHLQGGDGGERRAGVGGLRRDRGVRPRRGEPVRVRARARGQGKAGMGTADMKMTSTVVALGPEETEVTVEGRCRGDGDPGPARARHDAARQQEDVQAVHAGRGEGTGFAVAKM